MFGVGGEHDLTERELPHLAGWRDSRPVRVGNGAWDQRQLDVYGELLSAAQRLADSSASSTRSTGGSWPPRRRGRQPVERAGPGHLGGARRARDFLYSKLMCWVALDRAIALATASARRPGRGLGRHPRRDPRGHPRARLERPGRRLHPGLRQRGPRRVEPDDADRRLPARRRPAHAGDHRRHRRPAGRRARPGVPLPAPTTASRATRERSCCARSGWRRPRRWPAGSTGPPHFERAIALVNDVGLLAEEVDPGSGEMLGNFPQAFSHIGLINAAWAITQAREGPLVQ